MHLRRGLLVAAVLILALVLGGPASMADAAGRGQAGPALMETIDTTPIQVRISGNLFIIPHNYFRHPPRRDGIEEDAFVLRVLLPDLEPYTADNADEFRRGGFGRKMNILLHQQRHIRPLKELLDLYLDGIPPKPPSDTTFGLSHGIRRYRGDVFALEHDRGVNPVITCSPFRPDLDADCVHLFTWRRFTIQLRYGRDFLPQWQIIQEDVTALLEKFHESIQDDKE